MNHELLPPKHRDVLPELAQLNTDLQDAAGPSTLRSSREINKSTSPSTSVSSKTAAFFGASGNVVRPTSLSISSESSSHALGDIVGNSTRKGDTNTETLLWADSLSRYNSQKSSHRNSRLWDNFEGKPVTPLPSPGGYHSSMRSQGDFFDEGFDRAARREKQMAERTSRDSSWERTKQLPAAQLTTSTSISSLPASQSNSFGAEQDNSESFYSTIDQHFPDTTPPPSSASKTTNFFDEHKSILPASKRLSSGSNAATSFESPVTASPTSPTAPLSNRRMPSSTNRLYEPSRLPSASSEFGGFVAQTPSSSSSVMATPTARSPNPFRADASKASLPETDLQIPTATIVPPSPLPDRESNTFVEQGNTGESSVGLTSPKAKISGRHVHGPSENATGSSFLPSVQMSVDARKQNKDGLKAKTESNTAAGAEESEDESTGRIGRYQIETTLGVGAFSRVALASQRRRSSTRNGSIESIGLVALKMLEREPCMQNERMRVSWVREVEVLKHIVHPNVVRFLSSFSTAKHHTLVLERVGGGELFDFIADHHDKIAQREWLVRMLFGELANAVGWMHSINLVHRDIKLENILLTHHLFSVDNLRPSTLPSGPLLKISDFGLSRFIDPLSPLLETRCGSEEYAAPELIIGKRYDGRKTDVWAMGVVLYALLSGSLPFLGLEDQPVNSSSSNGVDNTSRGYSRERGTAENGAMARKAHLLRIAKGDLRWSTNTNEESADIVRSPCPIGNRLITPLAKRLVARLIRRDAQKRATAWESWDEDWMTLGSIQLEASAQGDVFRGPLDPRTESGQKWLSINARVHNGAPDLTHLD